MSSLANFDPFLLIRSQNGLETEQQVRATRIVPSFPSRQSYTLFRRTVPRGMFEWASLVSYLCPTSLLSLLTCSKETCWDTIEVHVPNGKVRDFLVARRLAFRAAIQCPVPCSEWTEDRPRCDSPFCDRDTGFWLPSSEEIEEANGEIEFPCGDSVWGSSSIRVQMQDRDTSVVRAMRGPALVACSRDCGREMRQMMKIRGPGRQCRVLVASWKRQPCHPKYRDKPIPSEYKLLSEIDDQVSSSAIEPGSHRSFSVAA